MQINTKHDVGDTVHFYPMNNPKNRLKKALIERISCSIGHKNSVYLRYIVRVEDGTLWDTDENSIIEDKI